MRRGPIAVRVGFANTDIRAEECPRKETVILSNDSRSRRLRRAAENIRPVRASKLQATTAHFLEGLEEDTLGKARPKVGAAQATGRDDGFPESAAGGACSWRG